MTEMIMPSSSSSSSSSFSSDREGKEISLDQTPNPNQITDLNQVLNFFLLLTVGINLMATNGNGGPRPSIFELELPLSDIYVNHSVIN